MTTATRRNTWIRATAGRATVKVYFFERRSNTEELEVRVSVGTTVYTATWTGAAAGLIGRAVVVGGMPLYAVADWCEENPPARVAGMYALQEVLFYLRKAS